MKKIVVILVVGLISLAGFSQTPKANNQISFYRIEFDTLKNDSLTFWTREGIMIGRKYKYSLDELLPSEPSTTKAFQK